VLGVCRSRTQKRGQVGFTKRTCQNAKKNPKVVVQECYPGENSSEGAGWNHRRPIHDKYRKKVPHKRGLVESK